MEKSEALKIVREYYPSSGKDLNEALETLIPELKESEEEIEDERIMKAIRNLALSVEQERLSILKITRSDILAWLEKRGEKNEHTKHPDMVANLKEYLANTPKEQLEKDWDELKHWNNVGPTVEEFLYGERRDPAKWSEHDNMILDSAIEILNSFGSTYETTLKGLRLIKSSLQPQWKPSDEQMTELERLVRLTAIPALESLYADLKKLKG